VILVLISFCGACETLPLLAPTDSTIDLLANPAVVPLGGKTTITAVVTEPAGTPVPNGTLVTFSATLGTLDPIEAQTADGRASVNFSAGSISGTATITAFSGDAISENLDVVVLPASP
jgi:hypothetical protein